jgi:hypothetical protein
MLPWLAVADELSGATNEVLFGSPKALRERCWHRTIDDLDA